MKNKYMGLRKLQRNISAGIVVFCLANSAQTISIHVNQISDGSGKPNCSRDLLKLKGPNAVESFVIDGMISTLNILGFMTHGGFQTVLHSHDNSDSNAQVMAAFMATPIPEPGTLGLVMLGFLLLLSNPLWLPISIRRQAR